LAYEDIDSKTRLENRLKTKTGKNNKGAFITEALLLLKNWLKRRLD